MFFLFTPRVSVPLIVLDTLLYCKPTYLFDLLSSFGASIFRREKNTFLNFLFLLLESFTFTLMYLKMGTLANVKLSVCRLLSRFVTMFPLRMILYFVFRFEKNFPSSFMQLTEYFAQFLSSSFLSAARYSKHTTRYPYYATRIYFTSCPMWC